MPGKELIFVFLLLALIIPYQALLTPIFFMFAQLQLTNTLVGLAIVHTRSSSVQPLHHAQQLRSGAAGARGGGGHRRLLELAGAHPHLHPGDRPAIVTVALFAFITSWNEFLGALVIMNRGATFTLPLILAECAPGDQHRRHRLGHAAGGDHDLDHPLRALLRAFAEILRFGLYQRRGEMSFDLAP